MKNTEQFYSLPFHITGIENLVKSFPIACLITENTEYDDRSSINAGNTRRDFIKSTAIILSKKNHQKK